MTSAFTETFLNPPPVEQKTDRKQKILFVVGGISPETYAFRDLVEHCKIQEHGYHKFYEDGTGSLAFGSDNTKYLYIKEINCEKIFDSKLLNFFSKFFLIGIPFRFWDRIGDYFKAILDEQRLKRIVDLIETEVNVAKKSYGLEVDVWGHSLGTLLLLASDIQVDECYLFGSPLTSKYWSVRKTAQDFRNKHEALSALQWRYGWSPKDIVCTKPFPSDPGYIQHFNEQYECPHGLSGYLEEATKKGRIKV